MAQVRGRVISQQITRLDLPTGRSLNKGSIVIQTTDGGFTTLRDVFISSDEVAAKLQSLNEAQEVVLVTAQTAKGNTTIRQIATSNLDNVQEAPLSAGGRPAYGGQSQSRAPSGGGKSFDNPSAAAGGLVHDVVALVAKQIGTDSGPGDIEGKFRLAETLVISSRKRIMAALQADSEKSIMKKTEDLGE